MSWVCEYKFSGSAKSCTQFFFKGKQILLTQADFFIALAECFKVDELMSHNQQFEQKIHTKQVSTDV